MAKLVLFELKKAFSKRSFKIILISIILVTLISAIIIDKRDYESSMAYYETLDVLVDTNKFQKSELKELNNLVKDNNKIYEYSLSHEKDYFNKSKESVKFSYTLLMFLLIVIIILASQIVTNEYQDKTIKLLFTMPYKRWKIMLSKFICMIIITLFLSLLLTLFMIIFTMIFNSPGDIFVSDLIIKSGEVIEVPFLLNFYKTYFILLIPVVFVMLISFSLSTMYLNTAFSVSISLFLSIGGMALFNFIVGFAGFFEYTFLPYLDFTIFNDKINIMCFNIENNVNLSIKRGIIILLLYSVLFYYLANLRFKKDVRC